MTIKTFIKPLLNFAFLAVITIGAFSATLTTAYAADAPLDTAIKNSGSNLLSNPTFSIASPKDWSQDAFNFSEELFLYNQQNQNFGKIGISIPDGNPNDARWVQTVGIEPNQTYILSGWIKTKDVGHTTESIDVGANLSVLNWGAGQGIIDIVSQPLFGTNGWTYREVQFNSGSHTQATVALRVGFFSGTTTGTAWFRDVNLQKIESAGPRK